MLSLPWPVLLRGALVLVDRLLFSSAVFSWVYFPHTDPRTGTEVHEQQRATERGEGKVLGGCNCCLLSQLSFILFI